MKTVAERIRNLEDLRKASPVELRDGLIKSLKDKSPTVRALAVEIIGDEELSEMITDVAVMLHDSNYLVRISAIESVIKLEDAKCYVREVSQCLYDKDELVRVFAAEFLGEVGDPTVLGNLEMALKDRSELVRSYAAESIGLLNQSQSVRVLEQHLLSENNETAKIGFYVALYRLKQKDSLEALLGLLTSDDYRVRCAVANSVSRLSLDSTEISNVKATFENALAVEKTVAARSSIAKLLEESLISWRQTDGVN